MQAFQKYLATKAIKRGSFTNVDLDGDGKPDGFQFRFRIYEPRVYWYVTHELHLLLDGKRVPPESLTLSISGLEIEPAQMVKHNLMSLEGDEVSVTVRMAGGLEPGKTYRITLIQEPAGSFGGPGAPLTLVDGCETAAREGP